MSEEHTPTGNRPGDAARWTAVFEAAVHAVITVDGEGRIDGFNRAAERMFRHRRDAVIGRNVRMLMPSPDAERHDGYMSRYQATGDPRIIGTGREVTGLRADGSLFPIHLSVGEFRIEGRRGFVAVIHDLSAQQAAERRVRERDQVLRLTFEEAPLASATLDTGGRVVTVNREFCRLFGWTDAEARGLPLVELIRGGPAEIRLDTALREWSCRVVDRRGGEHEVILHLNVVEDPEGSPSLFVAQFEDHTERLQAAAEARAARERLARVDRISIVGEMASGIAHEVNQPLSAIANYSRALVRMMKQHGIEDAELLATADKVHNQAQRAGEIIRRIRHFVSRQTADRESLDVNEVVEETLELAEIDGIRRDAELRLELASALPPILFDRIQLQQVVLNLIRNAVEADDRAEVVLRTVLRDGAVCVEVRDSGVGITEEVERHLFEPFFSTKGHGMGMGLAICRSIVEAQGGRLSFTRNPDRGVTFRIQLPTAGGEEP